MSEYWERLREERKRLGLSQTKFAEACGVKRTAQTTYETGARAPARAYFQAAAKIGVDTYYVMFGTRARDPSLESAMSQGRTDNMRWLLEFPASHNEEERGPGGVDAVLLGDILACLDLTIEELGATLTPRTRADLTSMLYRAFIPVGKVDRAVVEQAVRLVVSPLPVPSNAARGEDQGGD